MWQKPHISIAAMNGARAIMGGQVQVARYPSACAPFDEPDAEKDNG